MEPVFFWPRDLRYLVVLLMSLCWGAPCQLFAQSGTPPDATSNSRQSTGVNRDKLNSYLTSKKIYEIRLAVQMVVANPGLSSEYFSVVARRVNHPELTDLFRMMIPRCNDATLNEQLIQLTEARYRNARKLIRLELGQRKLQSPKPVIQVVPATPAGKSVSAPKPMMENVAEARSNVQNNAEATERLKRLEQLKSTEMLRDQDWDYLLDLIQNVDASIPHIKGLAQQVCRKHLANNEWRIRERLSDPLIQNRDSLVRIFYHAKYKEMATDECLWSLALSDELKTRTEAMNAIELTKENASYFADKLLGRLQTAPVDKATQAGLSTMVFHLVRVGSSQIRGQFFEYHLDNYEAELRQRDPRTPKPPGHSLAYSRSYRILGLMPKQEHETWVAELIERASRSKYPDEYLFFFSNLKCDISDATSFLEHRLEVAKERYDALFIARLLFRAVGPSSGAYALFKEVLLDPSAPERELHRALRGIIEVGPLAVELVPRIAALIESAETKDEDYSFFLSALREIGPGASAAGPTLIGLLEKPSQFLTLHRRVIQTLSVIKPNAEVVLPKLVEIAVSDRVGSSSTVPARAAALQLIGEYGSDAARFASALEPLTESESPTLARKAAESLRNITK